MHASAKSIYSSTGKNFARAEKSMFTELGPAGLFVAVMLEEMSVHVPDVCRIRTCMIGGTVRKKHLLAAVSVPVFSTNSKPAIDPWEGRNSTLPK